MPNFVPQHPTIAPGSHSPAVGIPSIRAQSGPYLLRMVQTEEDLLEVCRLRFRIFNLELGEGLQRSIHSGTDCDRFDRQCHHLLVEHRHKGVIGTYRLQIAESVGREGFYSAQEFDLKPIADTILPHAVELGRACIAKEHRKRKVLFLLWSGLAEYAKHFGKRYFFGCNSLTSQDPDLGWRTFDWLQHHNYLHSQILLPTTVPYSFARPEAARCHRPRPVSGVPPLFAAYLRYGSKVCSEPALDCEFGTIDFLTLLDRHELTPIQRARFRA